jgi:antitoxin VapB
MALNIKDEEVHRLARRLMAATGESMTTAVRTAIAERLARLERSSGAVNTELLERLDAIARRCGKLPVRSQRTEDKILGYDERGLPARW